ncbi:PEGA domain-containing protein [Candidatus Photodesmus blepharus]|uniref:PEGA domain-containing protein n=1 Tax=Candidatus Photodesmus blepharonis TaxID=1179155 RepID=UPI00054F86B3|nr:PEGA domain-containing protein [Candidatus Photodesmus blepharus]
MIRRTILALLLFTLVPFGIDKPAYSEESNPIATIDAKINIKQTELDSAASSYEAENHKLQQIKNELNRLSRYGEELNLKQERAKLDLDKQYNRLLEEPEIDLISFQKKYQESWSEVKQNHSDQLDAKQAITESEILLDQIKQKQDRLNAEFSNLQELRVSARIRRLESELRKSSTFETSFQTTCSMTMTLGECSNQGIYLTKQKAVKSFREKLFFNLSESALVKQNVKDVQLNIYIQENQIIRSGFKGENEHFTQMKLQLQAKPELTAACKLLNVSARYCLKGEALKKPKENNKKWVNVIVRSDQYNDSVTINGIKYGSTPIEVLLPKGDHQITVSKNRYETYNRTVRIDGNHTIWAKLKQKKNS